MSVNQPNTLPIEPSPLVMALLGVGAILVFAAFVCFILVVLRMFRRNQVLVGFVSIITSLCAFVGLFIAMIVGWTRAREWNIRGLMIAYTVSLLGGIALIASGVMLYSADLAEAMQNDPQLRSRVEEMQQNIKQNLKQREP